MEAGVKNRMESRVRKGRSWNRADVKVKGSVTKKDAGRKRNNKESI